MVMDAASLDRYLAALGDDELVLPKEVFARIEGAASDSLADALDDAADQLGCGVRFAIMDDSLVSWAKMRGNPWDLHEVLGELRALSARLSELTFAIQYDPDGPSGTLRAGRYDADIPVEPLARWVERFPRPNLVGSITHAQIAVVAPADACEQIRASLAGRGPIGLDPTPDGLAIAVPHAGHIAFAVDAAVRPLIFLDTPWSCRIALGGAFAWTHEVTSFVETIALGWLLGTALPYDFTPEPSAPIELPALGEIAAFLDGETLELEHDSGRFAIAADGSAHPLPPRPRPGPRPGSRRPLGVVGDVRVELETTLRLGRSKYRIVVLPPSGPEQRSAVLINGGAVALDPARARVIMTAERDGAPHLVAVAIPALTERVLLGLPAEPERSPRELIVVGDATIGVFWDRRETTLCRLVDDARFVPFARVPGAPEARLERDGDDAYLYATVGSDTGHDERTDLYQVSLVDGTVRAAATIDERGRVRLGERAGHWRAWQRRDSPAIQIVERLELRATVVPPAGREVWDFAISPRGTLAVVTTGTDGDAKLRIVRGEAHVEQALPATVAVRWSTEDA